MQPVTHELGAGPLHVGERERDVDRLLAGRLDERAGVDDDEVGVLGGRRGREPVGEQGGDDLVGVDGVLRAAERLDVEALGHRSTTAYRRPLRRLRRMDGTTVRLCGVRRAAPSTAPGSLQCVDCRVALVTSKPRTFTGRGEDDDDGGDDTLVELGEWPKLQAQILRRRLESAGIPVMIEWSGTTTDAIGILVVPEDNGDFAWAVVNEIDVDEEVPDASPHAYIARIEEHLSAAAGLLDELRTRLEELEAEDRQRDADLETRSV